MNPELSTRLRAAVRSIPDFPSPGIVFRDITPMLQSPELFGEVLEAMAIPYLDSGVTHVVAIESRGFLFGPSIALRLGAALTLVRKPGRLPFATAREAYALEYRNDVLEMHMDALDASSRVLVVDDILATGGTAAATARLVTRLQGTVVGASFFGELPALEGRAHLAPIPVEALIAF